MLDKAMQAVGDIKHSIDKVKSKKAYVKKKKLLEEERQKEEYNRAKQEALQAEYDRLSALDNKQLMTELIFAVRGFYSEFEEVKENSMQLMERIEELESDVSSLRAQLREMGEPVDS